MKEYGTEKRIYGKHIVYIHVVFRVVNVFRAVYTDRKNWGFSTSPSLSLPPLLCTSHRSGKIIAAADVKFDQDKVRGPKVMCRGCTHVYNMIIEWLFLYRS